MFRNYCLKFYGRGIHKATNVVLGRGIADNAVREPTLHLSNSYTRTKLPFTIGGVPIGASFSRAGPATDKVVNMYCCGPTVYDSSHLGHAITYTRCDLIRRLLREFFGLQVVLVQNITDIDDKIIARTRKLIKSENVSREELEHFVRQQIDSYNSDMASLNILPPSLSLRVTEQMNSIMDHIDRLERLGFTYINPTNGDICFDSSKISDNSKTDMGFESATDRRARVAEDDGKRSHKDFTLWKSMKHNEPYWTYSSPVTGDSIRGRPGWHVECSALATRVFKTDHGVDIHFGGHDLIFPHHYCESLCAHSDLQLDANLPVHSWSRFWLHSGHLIIDETKMSKSLGNFVTIKDFISSEAADLIRIICLTKGYRSDVHWDDGLLEHARFIRNRLIQFDRFLDHKLCNVDLLQTAPSSAISHFISEAESEILSGLADDLDWTRGLDALVKLAGKLFQLESIPPLDLVSIKMLLSHWTCATGIMGLGDDSSTRSRLSELTSMLTNFREGVRLTALDLMRNDHLDPKLAAQSMLKSSDNLRNNMLSQGFIVKDSSSTKK